MLPAFATNDCHAPVSSLQYDITIRNGERRKGRETVDDIEIAKVQWRPNLEKNQASFEEYDLSKLELNVRKDGGEWGAFKPPKKVMYLGHYTWNVPRIPCLRYEYQVRIPSRLKQEEFFCTDIKTKDPEDKQTLRNSGFKPLHPTSVEMAVGPSHASFKWNNSYCAEEYEIYIIEELKQIEEKSKTVLQEENSGTTNTRFNNLKPCTNYLIEIFAKVDGGETREEPFQRVFHTQPSLNSASFLNLNETFTTTDTASLTFFTYMDQVNCFNNYTIETCNTSDCFQGKIFDNVINHKEVEYTSTGLDHCTKYFLKVQPTYQGVTIIPKEVQITTKFNETAEKLSPLFEPEETSVKILMRNVDCFNFFRVSFQLDSNNEDVEKKNRHWEEGDFRNEGNHIIINNLQPSSTYDVTVTASNDHSGEQFTIFELLKFKTLPKVVLIRNTTPSLPIKISKENISNKNLNRVPRHYSANNSEPKIVVMKSIFSITLLLIFHLSQFTSHTRHY